MATHTKVGSMYHPISAMTHYRVAYEAKKYSPETIMDIGGVGKLSSFIDVKAVNNANIAQGYDGCNLSNEDNSYDVVTSVSTLEHVEDQVACISESVRVCRKAVVHWYPYGEAAQMLEKYKSSFPLYKHPCIWVDIEELIKGYTNVRHYDYQSVSECRLLLCTMYPYMNVMPSYDIIREHGHKPYGKIIVIEKE